MSEGRGQGAASTQLEAVILPSVGVGSSEPEAGPGWTGSSS